MNIDMTVMELMIAVMMIMMTTTTTMRHTSLLHTSLTFTVAAGFGAASCGDKNL